MPGALTSSEWSFMSGYKHCNPSHRPLSTADGDVGTPGNGDAFCMFCILLRSLCSLAARGLLGERRFTWASPCRIGALCSVDCDPDSDSDLDLPMPGTSGAGCSRCFASSPKMVSRGGAETRSLFCGGMHVPLRLSGSSERSERACGILERVALRTRDTDIPVCALGRTKHRQKACEASWSSNASVPL